MAGRQRFVISCLFCDSSAQLLRKLEPVMTSNLPIGSRRRCMPSVCCKVTKYLKHLPDLGKVGLAI